MIDVCYIVSHGFASRMVTQTDLLGKLVKAGLKVALVSPDKNDENLTAYCKKAGVELYEFKETSSFWSSRYLKARMYLLENINKNTALMEKYRYYTAVTDNRNWKTNLFHRGLKLVHDLKEQIPVIKQFVLRREQKNLISKKSMQLLKEINPKVVVSTYPVNVQESMLLASAKALDRKSVMHLLSWDNISCKGQFPTLADEYIAWGPIMRDEFIEYYDISKNVIHNCGVPHFDVHVTSRNQSGFREHITTLGLDADKPYLFIGMSSPRFAPFEIDIVEWLAAVVSNGEFGKDLQLVVRPHPQNMQGGMEDKSWLPRLQILKQIENVAVDFPDLSNSMLPWSMQKNDMVRLSELLAGASVSFNSGSTLSIDSLMCGTPVILTSFDGEHSLDYWKSARRLVDYNHLKKLISYGGVLSVNSYEEMTEMTKKILQDSSFLQKERQATLKAECGGEGNSTERVVEALLTMTT